MSLTVELDGGQTLGLPWTERPVVRRLGRESVDGILVRLDGVVKVVLVSRQDEAGLVLPCEGGVGAIRAELEGRGGEFEEDEFVGVEGELCRCEEGPEMAAAGGDAQEMLALLCEASEGGSVACFVTWGGGRRGRRCRRGGEEGRGLSDARGRKLGGEIHEESINDSLSPLSTATWSVLPHPLPLLTPRRETRQTTITSSRSAPPSPPAPAHALLQVVLIGDSGVGKSSVARRPLGFPLTLLQEPYALLLSILPAAVPCRAVCPESL